MPLPCLQHYSVVDRIVYAYAPLSMKRNLSWKPDHMQFLFKTIKGKTKRQPKNVLPSGHVTYWWLSRLVACKFFGVQCGAWWGTPDPEIESHMHSWQSWSLNRLSPLQRVPPPPAISPVDRPSPLLTELLPSLLNMASCHIKKVELHSLGHLSPQRASPPP